LALGDLDGTGSMQIVVGAARSGSTQQVGVYAPNGSVRAGWPRLQAGDPGYAAGVYNDNIAIADLNRSGHPQIYVPTDVHYILGLNRDGSGVAANAMYGAGKVWAQVGVHVLQSDDLQGYTDCGTPGFGLRPNFAASAPAIGDVNGDGTLELAVVGNVYDCGIGDPDGDLYYLPWLLNGDRSRFVASGYEWTAIPAPEAGETILAHGDFGVIEDAQPNAVLADLDGDGKDEILYSSYDGKVHAYWLDKTEHGAWPFAVPGAGIHFASPPAVADLYHDGKVEVIFATWPQKSTTETGKLYILDQLGAVLQAVDLPAPNGDTWNGGLAAPTLGWLPGSRNLAVVLMTNASGVVAYDLPQTPYARTLWPTGRGSYLRNGVAFNDRIFADGCGD
ncbi:MAG TPA: VCBS repeat-containing protein, partial [Rudaea sp.]|nr:VCBS repeat-containing protein [Rudaea sp.]